ncbi:YdcF family protein [Psychromonas sp. SR45-3]|uniref:YdcF family protein n=1 Tax=Psychromonas sp. SR45-3 TaxID=2760930 RepID=UPI0015FCD3AD|nr:YdcF family protein [Psychromonas sp. SR45-3]MBB1274919.1 YdcF family protein [Psychromonas sp. SR45-3]
MKKNIIAIALTGALALSMSPVVFAKQEVAVQAQVSPADFMTKRQVVDQLLGEALKVFESPARISHAGFTAKMPSNMATITERLLSAYALEPYRTDLLISAANAQVYNKNIDYAIELFEQALSVAPDDVDLNSYLAVWQKFKGNEAVSQKYMARIAELDSGQEADLKRIFKTIDRVVETPLKDKPGKPLAGNTAIVTLGYALNPDGSMDEILIKRLQTTLEMAKKQPESLIVLTGGVPKNHKTEGKLMADWLINKGVDKNRIIEENYATSTVDNALLSSYALARHNIDHATIISSASHVRRGQSLFEIASWQTGPKGITFDTVAFPDKPLSNLKVPSDKELLGIYRDALRTYGMWSYRSKPLLAR